MARPQRIAPGPGQESVWDYPRPPRVELSAARIRIMFQGVVIADSQRAQRVLETSHPPVYYVPPDDIRMEFLVEARGTTVCEWKGAASYWDVVVIGNRVPHAAWSYPRPTPDFAVLQRYLAFYPSKMDSCTVNDEPVVAQPGDFYGGWITSNIVGPFKGDAGTMGW
ncbi:MAG: DUF427 domain-containing protein [Herpetosiphon sp.]